MYEAHFGCRESPFRMTPDPRFFYSNASSEEAFAMLRYAIEGRKGFALLTGEVGTGKTTLLRRLMAGIGDTPFVLLFNPRLSFEEMLAQILHELELPAPPPGRRAAIESLNQFLLARAARGETTALLVDEAQDLGEDVLEELRLLSNLETDGAKLLQIVLVGQLELEEILARPSLRQLRQRIALRCRLERLSAVEVAELVSHRLRIAGVTRADVFERRALMLVSRYSDGLPRLVNVICDNAMLAAYADSSPTVRETHVREAAADLGLGAYSETVPGSRPEPVEQAMHAVGRSAARALQSPGETPPRTVRSLPWMITAAGIAAVALVLATNGGGALLEPLAREGLTLVGVRSAAGEIVLPTTRPVGAPSTAANGEASAPIPVSLQPPSPRSVSPVTPRKRADTGAPRPHLVQPTARPEPLRASPALAAVPPARQRIDWPSLPPRSEPFSLRVRSGLSLLVIAAKAYGPHCALGLDLLREENPEIRNLNVIRAGDEVRVPRIDRTRLVRDGGNGTLDIVVTSTQTESRARRIAATLSAESRGAAVRVEPRVLSPGLSYHRVVLGGIPPRELDATWTRLAKRGFVPREPVPAELGSFEGPIGAACVVS